MSLLQHALVSFGVRLGLDLPQNIDKTSVLESFACRNFLTCSFGIVTRHPLMLQLINAKQGNSDTNRMAIYVQDDEAIAAGEHDDRHNEDGEFDFRSIVRMERESDYGIFKKSSKSLDESSCGIDGASSDRGSEFGDAGMSENLNSQPDNKQEMVDGKLHSGGELTGGNRGPNAGVKYVTEKKLSDTGEMSTSDDGSQNIEGKNSEVLDEGGCGIDEVSSDQGDEVGDAGMSENLNNRKIGKGRETVDRNLHRGGDHAGGNRESKTGAKKATENELSDTGEMNGRQNAGGKSSSVYKRPKPGTCNRRSSSPLENAGILFLIFMSFLRAVRGGMSIPCPDFPTCPSITRPFEQLFSFPVTTVKNNGMQLFNCASGKEDLMYNTYRVADDYKSVVIATKINNTTFSISINITKPLVLVSLEIGTLEYECLWNITVAEEKRMSSAGPVQQKTSLGNSLGTPSSFLIAAVVGIVLVCYWMNQISY